MKTLLVLLQSRSEFLQEIVEGKNISDKIWGMLFSNFVAFFVYGFIIGLSHSWSQAVVTGAKLPALYIITLVICFPVIFAFLILYGSKQTMLQVFALFLTLTSVISFLLLAFAPVSLFFLLTTKHYQFFKLLNVGILAFSGIMGIHFLYGNFKVFLLSSIAPEKRKEGGNSGFLTIWLLLYGFVGCQMGWILRPFFGAPDLPFEIFREFQGSFFTDVVRSIGHILGFD